MKDKSDCCVLLVPSLPTSHTHIFKPIHAEEAFHLIHTSALISALVLRLSLPLPKRLCNKTKLHQHSPAEGWWNQKLTSKKGRKQDLNFLVPWIYSKWQWQWCSEPLFSTGTPLVKQNKRIKHFPKELIRKPKSWSSRCSAHTALNTKRATRIASVINLYLYIHLLYNRWRSTRY